MAETFRLVFSRLGRFAGVLRLLQPYAGRLAQSLLWLLVVPALRVRVRLRLSRLRAGGVTIVTVNWDSREYLEAFLRIVRHRSPIDVRIVVIDNGSHDGSRELLERARGISSVRLPSNVGHDLALDIGFLLADTEYVVALDIDAFPLHDAWLKELLLPLSSGSEISGAHLNRHYVHPCCLAMRTVRFVQRKHSFRSHYRGRTDEQLDASGEVAEQMSAREAGRLHFFEVTSRRGPGDVGTVFGDIVYHNFYSTRFQGADESVLDGRVEREDAAAAWQEALERYDVPARSGAD